MNTTARWLRSPGFDNLKNRAARKSSSIFMGLMRAVLIVGICYIILSPVLKIISNSVKDPADIYNPLVYLVPVNYTFANFNFAITLMKYAPTLVRTLSFTLGMAALQVLVTSMVGYGFARFKFPGSGVLFACVIITIVIPVQTYMVPLFLDLRYLNIFGMQFNLIGSFASVIVLTATASGLRSGLYIYIFRQFFKGMPKEIEEAALIDGAGQLRTFFTVMLPNATSAIITVVMFALVWQYNDTFYSSLFMTGKEFLSVKLVGLATAYQVAENIRDPKNAELVVNAGIILMITPIVTIYLGMQRYFMESIERSGIVG